MKTLCKVPEDSALWKPSMTPSLRTSTLFRDPGVVSSPVLLTPVPPPETIPTTSPENQHERGGGKDLVTRTPYLLVLLGSGRIVL